MSDLHFSEPSWLPALVSTTESNVLKREPVVLTGALLGPVSGLLAWFGGGTGDESAQVVAAVVAVVVFLSSWVLRQYVTPAIGKIESELFPGITDEPDTDPEPASRPSPTPKA